MEYKKRNIFLGLYTNLPKPLTERGNELKLSRRMKSF